LTDEGLANLIESTKCETWIYAEDAEDGPPKTLKAGMKRLALPSLAWCLDATSQKRYPYEKTWDGSKHDVVITIHTSGTTGLPKPIEWTNGFISAGNEIALSKKHWPRSNSFDPFVGKPIISSLPPQWAAGLYANLILPVTHDLVSVLPPANATSLPPAVFPKIMETGPIYGMFATPHTITQLYSDTATHSLIKSLDYIMYLGAPLDQVIGDDLCKHTRLVAIIGSTENGAQHNINPIDRRLWSTFDFSPESGHRMIRIEGSGPAADGSDDYYELVLERQHDSPNLWQRAFWNPAYKNIDLIETKELYAPVKDLDGSTRWRFHARKDDLTKLSWLAKFHAHDIEKRVLQHPSVSSVFVGGEGRPTPYVIIEPVSGALEDKAA
jgi:acyl-coenzyme A synthetase/AMP-(fatty) acid ligase